MVRIDGHITINYKALRDRKTTEKNILLGGQFASTLTEGIVAHEYGHTIQSLMFGPFYLLVIGIPSMVWSRFPVFRKKRVREKKSYFSVYPEKQATRLGEKFTGFGFPQNMV